MTREQIAARLGYWRLQPNYDAVACIQTLIREAEAAARAEEREEACAIVQFELDSYGHARAICDAIRARGETN